jgi:hypothetical protein
MQPEVIKCMITKAFAPEKLGNPTAQLPIAIALNDG